MLGIAWMHLKRRLFVSRNVTIGKNFHLGILSYVSTPHELSIGNEVYIGKFCSIQCSGSIGHGVLIANNVGIVGRRDHDYRDIGLPMSRVAWVGDTPGLARHPANEVNIGDDVWIGFGACILTGVTVGRGAIIAAGAVVTGDIEPYAVVSGNPAKRVGERLKDEDIVRHEMLLEKRVVV